MDVPQNVWWIGGAATIVAAVLSLILKKLYFDVQHRLRVEITLDRTKFPNAVKRKFEKWPLWTA
jgi:hypothetical protein